MNQKVPAPGINEGSKLPFRMHRRADTAAQATLIQVPAVHSAPMLMH
jgi:hypothetical protein